MSSKRPPAVFEALFEGAGIYPESIPMGVLAHTLAAVQRLASGLDSVDKAMPDGNIGLVKVKRGSAVFQFTAPTPELALTHLRETGTVLRNPEQIGERDYMLNPVEDLSAVARSLGCTIVLRKSGDNHAVLARIGPDSYADIAEKLLIKGDTTITGKVMRVGGAVENKCGLRIPSRPRMLYCRVGTRSVARKLGQKLYEVVVVQGTAVWLKTNWRIAHFTINEVYQPKMKSASETIEALRNAGGAGWDEIDDPEKYLEEVSGER